MKKTKINTAIRIALLTSAFGVSATAEAGELFIAGHDSDDHGNSAYIGAGLDYISFGAAATGGDDRTAIQVGYLGNTNRGTTDISSAGYTDVTFIDLDVATWNTTAFTTGFDILVVGTGLDAVSSAGSTELNSRAADFSAFFNADGGIFVHTDMGIGQSFYDFLPSFGTTANNNISTAGVFAPTAEGLSIGLTNAIVDADITHSFYTGVDTSLFTIFEVTDDPQFGANNGAPVALGLRDATIGGGGFTGGGSSVPEPGSLLLLGAGLVGLSSRRRKNKA